MDYVTFIVPTGERLTKFVVGPGTSIITDPRIDSMFLGLASGADVSVNPSFTSAAGLLGWTLVTQAQVGTDILPAIGKATAPGFPVPGATTFNGPLGAGTYSLWLYDGDEGASYSFNAVTAAVPEPATWAMMIIGFGVVGLGMRHRSTRSINFT
ncbi:PEPxxWA-CTERM sorting domain-containing protein (plasmid) [Polymorphobacter megasporae]|nr:PEPxxWA-CTERM sorting domain-containing protein [Polymorphobacter sp. PAMC 29334]UAJ12930.1 PEPxxWA-CTERM sorting domain-containing protein [Polymorphobacter megasporae]